MDRYIIETNHNPEECTHVMGQFAAYGHITHFEWGCQNGVCTGWAIIEAESGEQALLSVPTLLRNRSRAVKLSRFSPAQIQELHKQLEI